MLIERYNGHSYMDCNPCDAETGPRKPPLLVTDGKRKWLQKVVRQGKLLTKPVPAYEFQAEGGNIFVSNIYIFELP